MSLAKCLTTSGQRNDAETETPIPTTGAVFDEAVCFEANMSLQSPSVGGVYPTLTRRTHAAIAFDLMQITYPINMQIATRHNALGEGTGLGIGTESDPAFTLLRDHHHAVGTDSAVRRLTPVECERLQGFPDNYTAIPWRKKRADQCPDGPRYKALGNSMAVPVMRWIGERIAQVEALNLQARKDAA